MPKYEIQIIEFRYASYQVGAPDEDSARELVWGYVRDADFKTEGLEINQVSKIEED